MFGQNPQRSPSKSDGSNLEVQEIFATIQGEGPYVGHPAIFIRLGGCNLSCSFCDTEFEDFSSIPLENILNKVDELSGLKNNDLISKLVVITGGEPLRQNIKPLCSNLISKNYAVQIETNGTLFQDMHEDVKIVCSPKNNGSGYKFIREDLLTKITAFKFIISASNQNYKNVDEVGQSNYKIPVYVQPMDEYDENKNQENLQYTVKLSLTYGHLLCLQTHKISGIK